MSKRGENIYKRKDGRWEGRYLTYKDGAKKYISVYGRTYTAVKDKLLTARQNAAVSQAANNLPDCCLTVANEPFPPKRTEKQMKKRNKNKIKMSKVD